MKPRFCYTLLGDTPVEGAARVINHQGRKGINALSVRTRAVIPKHTVSSPSGSLTLWLMALEDLATITSIPHILQCEPDFNVYTVLSDNPTLREWESASFALVWCGHWYP